MADGKICVIVAHITEALASDLGGNTTIVEMTPAIESQCDVITYEILQDSSSRDDVMAACWNASTVAHSLFSSSTSSFFWHPVSG